MRIRKPHGRSAQPSLRPLLQSAQGNEKHEDEVGMGDAELSIDYSHAQRNSTAPSTESEELLPEMETGKEVAVRSVNPYLQDQVGEERVTSMANSLEIDGDLGMKKQGEEAEELTGLAALAAVACEELRGTSNLCPLLIEESESDSELPSTVDPSEAPESESDSELPFTVDPSEAPESETDSELPSTLDPSKAPEGSLLYALHLQLLGGPITVQELFICFEKPAEVLGLGADWKMLVLRHLKSNPYFLEAKGYHYLAPQPKRSPANIASTSSCYGASSSKTVLSRQHSTPATVQVGLSVDTREGGGRTRRKAFQKAKKAIAIAAMSEQATELEEMHQSIGDMQMLSSVSGPTDSQLVLHKPFWTSSRKRKSPPSDDEKLAHHDHPIPGGLQATQAEILATTEVHTGQRCVVLKDDTRDWLCCMMAMADDTLCNYHRSLQRLRDYGNTSLSPNSGIPKHSSAFKPWIAPKADVQTRVQYGHRPNSKDGTRSSQCCSSIAVKVHTLCEYTYHKQRRVERKARQRADAQQGKQAATGFQHNHDSSIVGLPESHTNLDLSSLSLHPKSANISPPIARDDTPSHTQAAKNVQKPSTGVSNLDDDSDGEQLQQQMPKNVPKRRYVAARKTAANVGALKSQRPIIQIPTIAPLPTPNGIRRKTPVKNRDQ